MDMSGWIEFFTEGLATQLAEVKRRGEQAIRRELLVGQHGVTARQALVLGHVLDRGRITIGELEELCPDTPRRTLQRDLKALADKGPPGAVGEHEPSGVPSARRGCMILRHSCATLAPLANAATA